jgi:hypothetical protein
MRRANRQFERFLKNIQNPGRVSPHRRRRRLDVCATNTKSPPVEFLYMVVTTGTRYFKTVFVHLAKQKLAANICG